MNGERMSGPGTSGPGASGQSTSEQGVSRLDEERTEATKETAARDVKESVVRRGADYAAKRFGSAYNFRELPVQLRATLLHNLPLKLGALLLATVFWLFVSTDDAVISQRTLRAPLHTEGLSETQRVLGLPEQVTVRLSGPASRLRALNPDGLDVVLNLRGVTGDFERGVRVFPPQGITAVHVVPSEIIGTVEARVQKEVPVQGITLTAPTAVAADTVLELRAEPPTVQVEGAETQVAQVTQVLAPYRPAAADSANVPTAVAVYAADAQGEPVAGVTVTPAQVDVSAEAKAVLAVRTLPLELSPVTVPGRRVVSATLAQDEVTLVGPESVLAGLSKVTATLPETPALRPGRYTLALSLDLPDGVTARITPQLELHVR